MRHGNLDQETAQGLKELRRRLEQDGNRVPHSRPPLSPRKQRVFRVGPEPSRARSGEANP